MLRGFPLRALALPTGLALMALAFAPTLFAWHPLCMTAALLLCSASAIDLMKDAHAHAAAHAGAGAHAAAGAHVGAGAGAAGAVGGKAGAERQEGSSAAAKAGKARTLRVWHACLHVAMVVLMAVGMGAIFLQKNRMGKAHFTTWHGKMGLCAVGLSLLVGGGSFAKSINWKRLGTLNVLWSDPMHMRAGRLVFVMNCIAAILGLWSGKWGANVLGQRLQILFSVCIGAVAVLSLVPGSPRKEKQ